MKGATAVPEVKTTRLPNRTRQIIIGNSQNFFRSFMKDQSSIKNSAMAPSLVTVNSERGAVTSNDAYCLLLTVYCLLPSTASLDGTRAGACGSRGSCRGRVSTAGP